MSAESSRAVSTTNGRGGWREGAGRRRGATGRFTQEFKDPAGTLILSPATLVT